MDKNIQENNQPIPENTDSDVANKLKKSAAPSSVMLRHEESYQGPIPPPAMMEQYKKIYMQAPEIILREFEENSKHIRAKEMVEIEGRINRDKRGQWMAFIICIAVLSIIFYSLYLGNITFAGLSGLGFIALMIKGFFKR